MTVTYPHDRSVNPDLSSDAVREEPFVPVYARTGRSARGRKGGFKTWMIMAPIGVVVLGVGAAAMTMGGGEDVAPVPLVEPAVSAPVLPVQPPQAEAPVAPIVESPAPVVRSAPASAPARASRRAAPAPAPAARATPATPDPVAAAPSGPQPYTTNLNATPAPAPTTAPPPVVVIEPAG